MDSVYWGVVRPVMVRVPGCRVLCASRES
jgi:hypothetical protein